MPLLVAALLAFGTPALAQPLEIVNQYGAVSVEIVPQTSLEVSRAGEDPGSSEGIVISRSPARLLVEALPPDGDSPDLEVRIPLGLNFSVDTADGDIALTGMVRRARVKSVRGSLTIEVPLDTTQLNLETTLRPVRVDLPNEPKPSLFPVTIHPRLKLWKLAHNLRSRDLAYGLVEGQLHAPPALTVRDWPLPPNWPLKPHTRSAGVVERLLAQAQRRRDGQPPPLRQRSPQPVQEAPVDAPADAVLFTSEVRMVSMSVAVSDRDGRPVTGLGPSDFTVSEDGKAQSIRVVDPEESPFNMAILLDLSGSTSVDLDHMREATLRLIQLARENDRVGIYAMAGSMFYRLVSLTSDRERLLARGRRLPYPSGGSPLWDTVVLAYDEDLAAHEGERNALIVISDGIDNRISGQNVPSMLRAARLIQAAGEMDARIYPIFLLSGERFGRDWSVKARARMEALAKKTGGRLFTARSVADIEPVLPELAREMRSVYEIAYYPANQDFDGGWRRVRIRVDRPGAQVRSRPGYFAR